MELENLGDWKIKNKLYKIEVKKYFETELFGPIIRLFATEYIASENEELAVNRVRSRYGSIMQSYRGHEALTNKRSFFISKIEMLGFCDVVMPPEKESEKGKDEPGITKPPRCKNGCSESFGRSHVMIKGTTLTSIDGRMENLIQAVEWKCFKCYLIQITTIELNIPKINNVPQTRP